MKKKKVLVGMSGGVDSSVAALLLMKQGFEVEGVHMKVGPGGSPGIPACSAPGERDMEDVRRIASILGIKFSVVDLSREYEEKVIGYFRREYREGRTPNPCVVCNRFLKFGALLEKAVSAGLSFDFHATGHYARIVHEKNGGLHLLMKGKDPGKEQSYFLFLLGQEHLSRLILPLGEMFKEDTRKIARKNSLPVSEKEESQDFASGGKDIILKEGAEEGDIVDTKGCFLGRHRGIIYYTVGQRKGLGVAGGKPLYVVGIDPEKKRIILGEKSGLYGKAFKVREVNYISGMLPVMPFRCLVKVRYRHAAAPAEVIHSEEGKAEVIFDVPQWAITPGQAAVFYREDVLLGGGFIEKVLY